MPERTNVFICCSSTKPDRADLERLKVHLEPFERARSITVWDDTHIVAGDDKLAKTEQAINLTRVAVILLSPDLLASNSIYHNELIPLLNAAKRENVRLLPVLLSACNWKNTDFGRLQLVNADEVPLRALQYEQREVFWEKTVEDILSTLQSVSSPEKPYLLPNIYQNILDQKTEEREPVAPQREKDTWIAGRDKAHIHASPFIQAGKRLALVVGVNASTREQTLPVLRCAENDARDIGKVLIEHCSFELLEEHTFIGSQADTRTIQDAIIDLAEKGKSGDTLLLYFSGHGIPLHTNSRSDTFLVTADFIAGRAIRNDAHFISMKWLREQLYQHTEASNVLIILDCCYAGAISQAAPDLMLKDMRTAITSYLGEVNKNEETTSNGTRIAIGAVSAHETAIEGKRNSAMTGYILALLQHETDPIWAPQGTVTPSNLIDYLNRNMPDDAQPTFSGNLVSKDFILTHFAYAEPGQTPQARAASRPRSYIPIARNPLFKKNPQVFSELERLLFPSQHAARVGLVGMPGIGKSQLATQIAYHLEERFPDGIFWITARGRNVFDLRRAFAHVAQSISYRPAADPGDEKSQAAYLAYYIAMQPQALLILDGVEDAYQVFLDLLPEIAGRELLCTIIYTSINQNAPEGITIYQVKELSPLEAHRLLLDKVRPFQYRHYMTNISNAEVVAATDICKYLGGNPLALLFVRTLLKRDTYLMLPQLAKLLTEKGIIDRAREYTDKDSLLATFQLIWDDLQEETLKRIFKLASCFSEAEAIPLWLVGLATELGEDDDALSPLHETVLQLRDLSMVDYIVENDNHLLRINALTREFGLRMVKEDREQGKTLYKEASARLVKTFSNLEFLERRAQKNYWICLEQLRTTITYLQTLDPEQSQHLIAIERTLDQASHLLADNHLWPTKIPGLFYQQMANSSHKEDWDIKKVPAQFPWLQQTFLLQESNQMPERIFARHQAEITSVSFSPDGKEILTSSQDGTALLVDTLSGQLRHVFTGHTSGVQCAAFSPDGRYVLTGSADHTARLWSWDKQSQTSHLLTTFTGHTDVVSSVAFSPDGLQILTGSFDKTAILWDLATGNKVHRLTAHTREVSCVAFSHHDGALLFTGSWDNHVYVWQRTTGLLRSTLSYRVEKLMGYQNPRTFQSTNVFRNPLTQQYEKPTGIMEDGQARVINSIAISPDNTSILIGSNDAAARLWSIQSGALLHTFLGHNSDVRSVAFSPDGSLVLTGSYDTTARLWSLKDARQLATFDHTGTVDSVVFSPHNQQFLTGSNDRKAYLWQWTSKQEREVLATEPLHTQPITCVVITPQGKLFTGSEDYTVCIQNITRKTVLQKLKGHTGAITSMAVSADKHRLLTGSDDTTVRLWNLDTGTLFGQPITGHSASVTTVAFSSDGSTFLTSSLDGTARIWKIRPGKQPHPLVTFSERNQAIETVCFSHNGDTILTGTKNGRVTLWHSTRKQAIYTLDEQSSAIKGLAFASDDQTFFTSASDGQTYIWETATGKCLGSLDTQPNAVMLFSFSPPMTEPLLLTCDQYNQAYLWKMITPSRYQLYGAYSARHRINSAYWRDAYTLILADIGGANSTPNVYALQLKDR